MYNNNSIYIKKNKKEKKQVIIRAYTKRRTIETIMYVVRHVLHVVPAQSELGGRDPYFFVFVFLFPKKKEENVVGFYPFFSPSQRNQIFSGSNNKHTHSLNLAISTFFFFVFFSPSAKSIKERGGRLGKRKKNQKNELFA